MTILVQIGLWLIRKCGVALLVVLASLVIGAVYLYLSENLRTEAERAVVVERLRAQLGRIEHTVAEFEAEMEAVNAEVDKQRQRAEIARRLLASFEQMNSFWDWLFGASVNREELGQKKAKASTAREDAARAIEATMARLAAITANREEALAELERTKLQIEQLEVHTSPVLQYLRRAWLTYRFPLVIAMVVYFFGPTLWSLAAFYGVAPLIARARPIRLSKEELPEIEVSASRVSEAIALDPGESVFVRERFLQASDESLKRKTRFVLDWSIPFTCAATGLIELVELTNAEPEGVATITVSTQDNTAIELGVVRIPEHSGLVLRPSFLAGLALPMGGRLRVRRHWRLFHLQSWVTLQFRFFEFQGPCRLVVAGSRGIRAESLSGGMSPASRGRRTNQDSTIGFTSDLAYRSVRAETFWSYYRDRNPLFDDIFQGRGTFLCQEVPTGSPGASVRRFWEAFWSGLLKIFGL
ncbi:MAG TPA: hypothetical protein VGA56_07945 [Opitutaceae bacterium]